MAPEDSSVDLLAQAILGQAEAEAKKIRENAETEAAQIISEAEQEASRHREKASAAAAARVERENVSALAAVRLEARRRVLEAREELIERVFAGVKERLETLRRAPRYPPILVNLVREALDALEGEDFVVAVARDDYDLAKQALASAPIEGKRIDVRSDERVRGGGCIVSRSDGRALYDNTFSAIIARHHLRLRALVAEVLWGRGRRWDEI
jgi:V/A-type H+-transporting ATPase subunit E